MKTLHDLVCSELDRAKYVPVAEGNIWKHELYDDYWLVCQQDGTYLLDELQQDLRRSLIELFKDFPQMEKNLSLLLLNKVSNNSQKNPHQVIREENNPYDFKKYIIQYTEEEWLSIQKFVPNGIGLADAWISPENFEELKKEQDGPASFLYNLAHKLPFVTLDVRKKNFTVPEINYKDPKQLLVNDWLNKLEFSEHFKLNDNYISSEIDNLIDELFL